MLYKHPLYARIFSILIQFVEEYMDNKAFLKTMLNLLFVGALFFLSIIFWLETGTRTNTPLSVVLLVLFAFILAANIILGKRMYIKYINERITGRLKESDISIDRLERKIKISLAVIVITHIAMIYFAITTMHFLNGLPNMGKTAFIPAVLFAFTVVVIGAQLWGLFDIVLNRKKKKPLQNTQELFKKTYPNLFKIAKEAADTAKIEKDFRIFLDSSSGVKIFKSRKQYMIVVGALPMNILSMEELKQVLIHQFIRVQIKTHRLERFIDKASSIYQVETRNILVNLTRFLIKAPSVLFNKVAFTCLTQVNRHAEDTADAQFKQIGSNQVFVNALAKLEAFSLFEKMPCPERDIYLYESKKPIADYASKYLDIYYKYLDENKSYYMKILDTSPSFKTRREFFGIQQYMLFTKETDTEYIKEQSKILALENDILKKNMTYTYTKDRDRNYVKRFAAISGYEKNPEQDIQTLLHTALCYEGVDTEKSKEILNSILEKDSKNAGANFHLGRILIQSFDKSGIEYIKKALKTNPYLAKAGLNIVEDFCTKFSLFKELDDLKTSLPETQVALGKNEEFSPHDLADDYVEEITSYITQIAEDNIEKIFLVKKADLYLFLLVPTRDADLDKLSDVHDKIMNYLLMQNTNYILLIVPDRSTTRRLKKKVKNSYVWSIYGLHKKKIKDFVSQEDNWYLRQQKRRGFGFFISLYTLAGLTSFGVYIDLPYHKHIAVAIGTLLLSSFAINLLLGKRLWERFSNTRIAEQRKIMGQIRDEAEKNLKRIEKRMKLILNTCWFFHIFLILLCVLGFSFSFGFVKWESWPAGLTITAFLLVYLLSSFMLAGLVDMLACGGSGPLPENELLEKDYPKLFSIARGAADITGAGKNIRIFLGDNNVGVFKHGKYDCILIGEMPMNLLTMEEMKQTLIHEFAHVYNGNTKLSRKLIFAAGIWQTETDNKFINFLRSIMIIPAFIFQKEYFLYTVCAKRVQEIEADNIVKKLGDRQVYINALAKHAALSLFQSAPCPEWSIYIYESEEPLKNYASIYLDLYYKYLEKNEAHWRRIMDNELTPFIDSHPTFKARKESMGVENYDLHTKETDKEYKKEQKKMLKKKNKILVEGIADTYDEIRDYVYVKRFDAIKDYEQNSDKSIQELITIALYYEGVDTEKAKEILNTILEKDKDNAYAYYHLGRILLDEFDKQGIDYIYKAIERNDGFAVEGFDLIGTYCIKAGLQEELEEYRRNIVDMGQKAVDKSRAIAELNKEDKVVPHDLDKKTLDEILQYMTTEGKGKLAKIMLVKKIAGELYTYVFLIKFANYEDEDLPEIFNKIYTYLDLREEQFTLLAIFDESKLKWLHKRVENCVVWSDMQ
jgi:hypothetical protein